MHTPQVGVGAATSDGYPTWGSSVFQAGGEGLEELRACGGEPLHPRPHSTLAFPSHNKPRALRAAAKGMAE